MGYKHARAVSSAIIATLLMQMPVPVLAQTGDQAVTQRPERGMCRRPGALPDLGQETGFRPPLNQRSRHEMAMALPAPPPPPPVAASVLAEATAADSVGDVVVTGAVRPASVVAKATSADRGDARHMPPPGWRPRPGPAPQSGLLTAGEHDDLLNPELYASYVRRSNLGQAIPDLPVLDTQRVLTVAVRDSAGQPVRGAKVEVLCADGNSLTLATTADGNAVFFPALDRLGSGVKIRADGTGWRQASIGQGAGGQQIGFTLNRPAREQAAGQAAPKLDLMLAIDTTGSMGDEIRYLQAELAAIIDGIKARHPGLDVRLGFVFYRDLGDDYVTRTVPLSANIRAGQAALAQHYAGGGGDYPEAMEQALIRAAQQPWRTDAVKTLLLVGDAPPHDENFGKAWLAAEHLRANRVQVVPVAASGVADKAEYLMRAIAALTQSRYTFLTDDSGIGNAHAKPAIDCYLVTRLDKLLRRVIDSQISGRRIEPDKQDVIREVGQYDNGRCILPRGWQGERDEQ